MVLQRHYLGYFASDLRKFQIKHFRQYLVVVDYLHRKGQMFAQELQKVMLWQVEQHQIALHLEVDQIHQRDCQYLGMSFPELLLKMIDQCYSQLFQKDYFQYQDSTGQTVLLLGQYQLQKALGLEDYQFVRLGLRIDLLAEQVGLVGQKVLLGLLAVDLQRHQKWEVVGFRKAHLYCQVVAVVRQTNLERLFEYQLDQRGHLLDQDWTVQKVLLLVGFAVDLQTSLVRLCFDQKVKYSEADQMGMMRFARKETACQFARRILCWVQIVVLRKVIDFDQDFRKKIQTFYDYELIIM